MAERAIDPNAGKLGRERWKLGYRGEKDTEFRQICCLFTTLNWQNGHLSSISY
jgi:hypothetical protein